jgi:hypothetical protein
MMPTRHPNDTMMRAGKPKQSSKRRRGQIIVEAGAPRTEDSLERAFARIDQIRKTAKPLPKGMTIKDLIEEGRR